MLFQKIQSVTIWYGAVSYTHLQVSTRLAGATVASGSGVLHVLLPEAHCLIPVSYTHLRYWFWGFYSYSECWEPETLSSWVLLEAWSDRRKFSIAFSIPFWLELLYQLLLWFQAALSASEFFTYYITSVFISKQEKKNPITKAVCRWKTFISQFLYF